MRIDWYDRRILTFVLEMPPGAAPPDDESFGWFGMEGCRVMRRFDAVVNTYTSHDFPLDAADLDLLLRAASHRRTGEGRASKLTGPHANGA